MDMAEYRISPCKFCGSRDVWIRVSSCHSPKIAYNVICHNCFANTGWFDTKKGAADAWNRTAPISKKKIKKAEQCLIDNGIQPEEANVVLQAVGYILTDTELYLE